MAVFFLKKGRKLVQGVFDPRDFIFLSSNSSSELSDISLFILKQNLTLTVSLKKGHLTGQLHTNQITDKGLSTPKHLI